MHKRNKYSKIAGLMLLILAGIAVLASAEANKPVMILEEIVHDFGIVFEAQNYRHTFIVKNEGKADLIIKSVKPG